MAFNLKIMNLAEESHQIYYQLCDGSGSEDLLSSCTTKAEEEKFKPQNERSEPRLHWSLANCV